MNDIVVPGWVALVIVPAVMSWMIWITLNTFSNKTDLKLNEANDQSFRAEIRKDVADIKSNFQNLSNTILNLFGQEISVLKSVLGVEHK